MSSTVADFILERLQALHPGAPEGASSWTPEGVGVTRVFGSAGEVMNTLLAAVPSQSLPDVDYAQFDRSLGLQGISVDQPDQVGAVGDEARAATRR